jgi:hypothetical protein
MSETLTQLAPGTKKVYALLVGVATYHPAGKINNLTGPVNDVELLTTFLKERVGEERLQPLRLVNEAATREAVIAGFRNHLSKAGPNDVALFYFSGHGSQVMSPPEFVETDRLNETLVLYDSRSSSTSWDLADKELRYLIWELSQRGPHIVVILDSCHSGTGTRADGVRRTARDIRQRPFDTYDIIPEAERQRLVKAMGPAGSRRGFAELPVGKHILLAACQDEELAVEQLFQKRNGTCGVFTHYLLEVLGQSQTPTYNDLWRTVHSTVQRRVASQHPYIEENEGSFLNQPFLGGAVQPVPPVYAVVWDDNEGWVVEGGAVHGFALGAANTPLELAIFPAPIPRDAEGKLNLADAAGRGFVTRVGAGRSRINVVPSEGADLDRLRAYDAILLRRPLIPFTVQLDGDAEEVARLRPMLATGNDNGLYLNVKEHNSDNGEADFVLTARNNRYVVRRADELYPLVAAVEEYGDGSALTSLNNLEHMARWMQTAQLRNSSTQIPQDAVSLQFYRYDPTNNDEVVGDGLKPDEMRISYRRAENGAWISPTVAIVVRNEGAVPLYMTVLDMTDRYKVAVFPQASATKVEPGNEILIRTAWSIPEPLLEAGVIEYRDLVKVIASTTRMNPRLLEQPNLNVGLQRTRGFEPYSDTLTLLLQGVSGFRDADAVAGSTTVADWTTKEGTLTIVHPGETVPLPAADGPSATIASGAVQVHAHPALRGRVRAAPEVGALRALNIPATPPLFQDNPAAARALQFTRARDGAPGASTLELSELENPEAVTPDHPLRVTVHQPITPDEVVIAYAFDEALGMFLPVGHSARPDKRQSLSSVDLVIDQLPTSNRLTDSANRDLKSAAKVAFRKLVLRPLGFDYDYPRLGHLRLDDQGRVVTALSNDLPALAEAIAPAEKVLLYVHGWTGESAGMATSAFTPDQYQAPLPQPLVAGYDVVLIFDYESLHTGIDETARDLKQRLAAVGLGANHGKTLHIVAHSMGGLVSRWFIEQEGGKAVVQHLVMLGTPNGGLPWPMMQKWANHGLTLLLNYVGLANPAVQFAGWLVGAIEFMDKTVDQMQNDSAFFRDLNGSPDPHVQYTCIGGNAEPIPRAVGEKLLRRANLPEAALRAVEAVVFGDIPNDLFISVPSVHAIDDQRAPKPRKLPVPSTHMDYFTQAEGIQTLQEALS